MFRFYLNHYQVRFYVRHDVDRAQQQQTLVMFPCIVTAMNATIKLLTVKN
jgi:hypothetical protein